MLNEWINQELNTAWLFCNRETTRRVNNLFKFIQIPNGTKNMYPRVSSRHFPSANRIYYVPNTVLGLATEIKIAISPQWLSWGEHWLLVIAYTQCTFILLVRREAPTTGKEIGKDVGRLKHRSLTSKLACKEQTNKMGGFEIRNPLTPGINCSSEKWTSCHFFL